jgi:hypothetical protein
MWAYPLDIRKAATRIFPWPTWSLYNSIKRDKFVTRKAFLFASRYLITDVR